MSRQHCLSGSTLAGSWSQLSNPGTQCGHGVLTARLRACPSLSSHLHFHEQFEVLSCVHMNLKATWTLEGLIDDQAREELWLQDREKPLHSHRCKGSFPRLCARSDHEVSCHLSGTRQCAPLLHVFMNDFLLKCPAETLGLNILME